MAAIESTLHGAPAGTTVVVSDNSTDEAEAERLRAFCTRHPAGPVYLRPREPIPMAAHWEWLWTQIRAQVAPTHVAYLTDRLVFAEGALAELVAIADGDPGSVISYHHDHVMDMSVPVELVQTPWTGQVLELDCGVLTRLSSRGAHGNYLPRLMNSVVPTSVIESIERRFGDVFGEISPDYRFAYRCLAVCEKILYLDRACMIEHGMPRSAGVNYLRGTMNADATRFARELSVDRFGATPEPAFETVANAIFQEYCSVRAELGDGRFPELDRWCYLRSNAQSVDRIREPGLRARMDRLLERHGWTRRDSLRHVTFLAAEMAAYLLLHPAALARTIKRQLWDRPPGTPAAYLLPRLGLKPGTSDQLRFASDIAAIEHANACPRPRTPYAWHVHRLRRAGAIVRRRSPSEFGISETADR